VSAGDDPEFLGIDEVLAIHRDQVERYGGSAGVRDLGLLESAVATPKARFGGRFLHADLFEMAAAYLFHIANNHPFVDGNKRTGAVAAFVFLALNGIDLDAPEDAYEALARDVAEGQAGKREAADFFRRHGSG
jgi:death on curing protein